MLGRRTRMSVNHGFYLRDGRISLLKRRLCSVPFKAVLQIRHSAAESRTQSNSNTPWGLRCTPPSKYKNTALSRNDSPFDRRHSKEWAVLDSLVELVMLDSLFDSDISASVAYRPWHYKYSLEDTLSMRVID